MKNSQLITREIFARAITDDLIANRQAEFVISSETEDTYGTVFKIDGWDLTRYEKNPIVIYHHDQFSSNPDVIIGTSEVRREGNQLIARVTFEAAETNPLAEKVFQKVKNGILRMASIGCSVQEYRYGDFDQDENPDVLYFTRMQLLEWSIVPIGSNPDALKRSQASIQEIKDSLKNNKPKTEKRGLAVAEADVELKLKMYK